MRSLWKITIFGIIFTGVVLLWIFVIGVSSNQPGSFFNKEHNAVWLGHQWVGESKTDAEIQKLVNTLSRHQIDTVFVHSGPLTEDGTVDPETYKYSVDFLDTARTFDDQIQYQAWLGQIRSKIDLSDPDIRHNISNEAITFSQLIGFDGIHFDIEPVWDEDTDFIKVLEETRAVLPDEKKISVALAEFIPENLIWFLEGIHEFKNYNSEVNYQNVAEYADQIVVMVYDTGINRDWLYRWLVQEQTIRLTDLFDEKEVFIGIPAYEELKPEFDPETENIKTGLEGIVGGLNNIRSNEDNFAGVAIYPYWEIEDDEWEIYTKLWQK